MPIRDIAITIIILGAIPFILRRPYVGVFIWSWISYMNPHRLTWGFAFDMPFAQIIAITLLISMLFSKEKISIPFNKTVGIWMFFIFWMGVTSVFAIYPDAAMLQLIKVVKIQLITFITMMLITTQDRVNKLIWVIVLSIGYFSTKGGLFTILTGGASRVWGPPGGFIQENNSLALATLMIIPLMVYLLNLHRDTPWIKAGLCGAIGLSLISVIGSQSRGALVAIVAVSGFFWLKSHSKFLSGSGILLLSVVIYNFMPASWHERMDTISHYQEDGSAMGRINAWKYSINVASDRLLGAGFESWTEETFEIWAPVAEDVHAAHSIYFGVLADHGWLGLILFLAILLLTWLSLSKIIRLARKEAVYKNQAFLARMLQVSLIAYMSGGAFLSLAYFDLPWHIIAIAVILQVQVKSKEYRPKGVTAVIPRT